MMMMPRGDGVIGGGPHPALLKCAQLRARTMTDEDAAQWSPPTLPGEASVSDDGERKSGGRDGAVCGDANAKTPTRGSSWVHDGWSIACGEGDGITPESPEEKSKKLSQRLGAYGASTWMCKRVTLGDVTLVPGIGGVAVIPELDLSSRQRNRLRATRRPLATPPSSLFGAPCGEDRATHEVGEGPSCAERCGLGAGAPGQKSTAGEYRSITATLLRKMESDGILVSDDDESDDGHADGNLMGYSDVNTAYSAIRAGCGVGRGAVSPPSPHSLEASAPWYSRHRRPQRIRDEVRRDINAMLEKGRPPPPRTISRERVEELARPRRHEACDSMQRHLCVTGRADSVCRSRQRQQKSQHESQRRQREEEQRMRAQARAAALATPESPRVAEWRVEKHQREMERAKSEAIAKEEDARRSKVLHHYLSENASQTLSSYIEGRRKLLERAKEKREKSSGTFNTLKGGGCWDLQTLRQQGIRVIR